MFIFKQNDLKKNRFAAIDEFLTLNLLSKDVFLAGGAIRSLFDSEEPKDYDLFFRTTEAVPKVRETLKAAGYDLIFACPQGKLFSYQHTTPLDGPDGGFKNIKVQLILENTGSPETIIDDFDFNACRAAMDDTFVYIPLEFVKDIITKTLTLHKITFPVATIKRFAKYREKGFNINKAVRDMVQQLLSMGKDGVMFNEEELRIYID